MSVSINPILVDKPYGLTPLACIELLREKEILSKIEKATYAGRLDPLATGLLLILHGEDVHMKDNLLHLEKEYIVELAFGVKTDTGDLLGLIMNHAFNSQIPSLSDMRESLESIQQIAYPLFSSKPVQGKPLHVHAREKNVVLSPMHTVKYVVQDININNDISSNELRKNVMNACAVVQGDFRQKDICASWQQVQIPILLQTIKMTIRAMSGTYMRSIPDIIFDQLNIPCVVTKIRRTKIVQYSVHDKNVISFDTMYAKQ